MFKINRKIVLFGIVFLFAMWFLLNNFFFWSIFGNRISRIDSGSGFLRSEMVSDNQKMRRGLGKRIWMCDSCAMFFYFDEKGKHSFWMKDMNFSLDIVWLLEDEVVWIEKSVSHENPERVYSPPVQSNGVLETRAGVVERSNINVGDRLKIK